MNAGISKQRNVISKFVVYYSISINKEELLRALKLVTRTTSMEKFSSLVPFTAGMIHLKQYQSSCLFYSEWQFCQEMAGVCF